MSPKQILLAAVMFGGIGGYGWSVLASRPAPAAASRNAETDSIPKRLLPASPEEQPGALDAEWAARADGEAAPAPAGSSQSPNVHYSGCNEVRALGKAPLYSGQPGYRAEMDGDGDGVACEPVRR